MSTTTGAMPSKAKSTKEKEKHWQLQPAKLQLQKCWVWNNTITAFVKERLVGVSLNVCAGLNPLCTVNLDLDPQDRRIIKGDMRLLPFDPDTFDTVVSDPPWKIGYYERFRPFFECVRVCKVGGRIIYNGYWIPMVPSGDAVLKETWIRQDKNFTNTSVISIFEKVQSNPTYEAAIRAEQVIAHVKLRSIHHEHSSRPGPRFTVESREVVGNVQHAQPAPHHVEGQQVRGDSAIGELATDASGDCLR